MEWRAARWKRFMAIGVIGLALALSACGGSGSSSGGGGDDDAPPCTDVALCVNAVHLAAFMYDVGETIISTAESYTNTFNCPIEGNVGVTVVYTSGGGTETWTAATTFNSCIASGDEETYVLINGTGTFTLVNTDETDWALTVSSSALTFQNSEEDEVTCAVDVTLDPISGDFSGELCGFAVSGVYEGAGGEEEASAPAPFGKL